MRNIRRGGRLSNLRKWLWGTYNNVCRHKKLKDRDNENNINLQ